MKCPECAFTSFDSLDSCRKCGRSLNEARSSLGFFGAASSPPPPEKAEAIEETVDDEPCPEAEEKVTFGFDFMKREAPFEFETRDLCGAQDGFEERHDVEASRRFEVQSEPEKDPFAADLEEFDAPDSPVPALFPRILASSVDLAILTLVFFLFLSAGEMADGGEFLPSPETMADRAVPYFLILFAICFGYFTLFHFLSGQPPGKMLFGLRVESEESGPLSFSQAFLRSVGGLLSALPAGLGFLGIACDGERRGWSDRLAGTRVVRVVAGEVAAEEWRES